MSIERRKILAYFLLSLIFLGNLNVRANEIHSSIALNNAAEKFMRTELYFGTDKPGGGKVSDEDWDKFLETIVTPRFPSGFTVLEGFGQYKDSTQKIVREESKVLVLFYPKRTRADADRKIEEIRNEYKKQFNQESVLRLDFMKSVNVKF